MFKKHCIVAKMKGNFLPIFQKNITKIYFFHNQTLGWFNIILKWTLTLPSQFLTRLTNLYIKNLYYILNREMYKIVIEKLIYHSKN